MQVKNASAGSGCHSEPAARPPKGKVGNRDAGLNLVALF